MSIKKKYLFYPIACFFLLSLFAQKASTQCDSFSFPNINNTGASFFSCETGELKTYSLKNESVVSTPRKESLGGFIHKLVWSPDGKKILVLAENIPAAKQQTAFTSPERELGSLNWWLYNLDTSKSTLLAKDIILAGWISNNEIVYNWNNDNLFKADTNNLTKYTELTKLTPNSNTLDDSLIPLTTSKAIIFPIKNGFYKINPSSNKADFFSLSSPVFESIVNQFNSSEVIFRLNSSLVRFNIDNDKIETIDTSFSGHNIIFYQINSLAFLGDNDRIYIYYFDSGKKELLSSTANTVDKIFPLPIEGEFLFIIGDSLYKNFPYENPKLLMGQSKNITAEKTATQTEATTKNKLSPYVIILLVILSVILGFVIYRYLQNKKKNESENKNI